MFTKSFFKAYQQRVTYNIENAINFMFLMSPRNFSPHARYALIPILFTATAATFLIGLSRLIFSMTLGLITNAVALKIETHTKTEESLKKMSLDSNHPLTYQAIFNLFLVIDRHAHSADPTVILETLSELAKIDSENNHDDRSINETVAIIQNQLLHQSKRTHLETHSPYWNRIKFNISQSINMLRLAYSINKELSILMRCTLMPCILSLITSGLCMLAFHTTVGWLTTYLGLKMERAAQVDYALAKKGLYGDNHYETYRKLFEKLFDVIDLETHTTDLNEISSALKQLTSIRLPAENKTIGELPLRSIEKNEKIDRLLSCSLFKPEKFKEIPLLPNNVLTYSPSN